MRIGACLSVGVYSFTRLCLKYGQSYYALKKQRQHQAEGHIYLLLVFLRDMAATWTD